MNPETKLRNEVRATLLKMGVLVFTNAQVGRTHRGGLGPGSADLIAIVRGQFFALELKTKTGVVSEAQREWGTLVEAHGGAYHVVRSVDEAVAVVMAAKARVAA